MKKLDFYPRSDETALQYLWRVGNYKTDNLIDLPWSEIAEIINNYYGDEDTHYGEAKYRKEYSAWKRAYDELFSKEDLDVDENFAEQLETIKKERQKLSDERAALNKRLREEARAEENYDILADAIAENGRATLPPVDPDFIESDNDEIICLSDIHLGLTASNNFGAYNSDIAQEYMTHYLEKILEIQDRHNSEDAYVVVLGDLISGQIHLTLQLENRENAIQQTQIVSEMISNFLYELSKHFNNVYVVNVSGNHSRIGLKKEVLRQERLDEIPVWYAQAKLSHIENIEFLDDNIDPTIGEFECRGKTYLAVHGDYDSYSESGVQKLVMMTGEIPEAIFTAHKHFCSYEDISNVKYIRSGSFCGAVGDFEITHRLCGKPSQMVCIATDNGIETLYPVALA